MNDPMPDDSLQFDTIEPAFVASNAGSVAPGAAGGAVGAACLSCRRPITDVYYEIGGRILCAACRDAVQASVAGGRRVMRLFAALILGLIATVVSAGIWMAIVNLTGYAIGLVAIVVGIIVGVAVRKGSNNLGGWPYQIMAVVLTYLAITASNIPMLIRGYSDFTRSAAADTMKGGAPHSKLVIHRDGQVILNGHETDEEQVTAEINRLAAIGGYFQYYREGRGDSDSPAIADRIHDRLLENNLTYVHCLDESCERVDPDAYSLSKLTLRNKILMIAICAAMGLVLPFYAPAENIIGILIIGFALWQAWRINRRAKLAFTGPHRIGLSSAAAKPVTSTFVERPAPSSQRFNDPGAGTGGPV